MTDAPESEPAEPTVFTRIIRGELPGRFVDRSDSMVAFLTIAPIRPGHTLVVPVRQVDRWTDLTADEYAALSADAHRIATALESTFPCNRVALIIAGLEVPHCHIHLVPIDSEADLSFALADPHVSPDDLDAAAARIRTALGTQHLG